MTTPTLNFMVAPLKRFGAGLLTEMLCVTGCSGTKGTKWYLSDLKLFTVVHGA